MDSVLGLVNGYVILILFFLVISAIPLMIGFSQRRVNKAEDEYYEEANRLSCETSEMLVIRKNLKIINGSTESDFEKAYHEYFAHVPEPVSSSRPRLGDIIITDKSSQMTYSDGQYVALIEYEEYVLRDGVSPKEYQSAVNNLKEFVKQRDEYIKQRLSDGIKRRMA